MSEITPEERANLRVYAETAKLSCVKHISILPDDLTRLLNSLEQSEVDAKEWKEQIPEECPITGLPYFNSFKNSAGVYQPFYGGPCDVYGIPYKDEDGYLCRKHLCLDSMREEDENMCLEVVEEERMIDLGEAEAQVARLTAERDWLAEKIADVEATDEDGRFVLTCPNSKLRAVGHDCDKIACWQCWKEAARRAVDSEGEPS